MSECGNNPYIKRRNFYINFMIDINRVHHSDIDLSQLTREQLELELSAQFLLMSNHEDIPISELHRVIKGLQS